MTTANVIPEQVGASDFVFWAKLPRDIPAPRAYHPVLCHLIDVAAVTEILWREVLTSAARSRTAEALRMTEDAASHWVPFLAGLHDIGKVSPSFQLQVPDPEVPERLRRAGFAADQLIKPARPVPHGDASALSLQYEILCDPPFNMSGRVLRDLAVLIGGHHGLFPMPGSLADARSDLVASGPWQQSRKRLAAVLQTMVGVPVAEVPGGLGHPAAMFLAGLVSVADWIGSNSDFFTFAVPYPSSGRPVLDAVAYLAQARACARLALERLGWLGWTATAESLSFAKLFGFEPRGVQHEAIALGDRLGPVSIAIVEAPMGEGKTEAAMYLADAWSARNGLGGYYFALPTQATSNQMFSRVRQFLGRRYPADVVNLQLLHGHSALSAEFEEMRNREVGSFQPTGIAAQDGTRGATGDVLAAEWFTYRKRGLLAPFGVGTIDQALLGILQSKHVFVRLFGLAHKTVIVDEVHAYDLYLSTLLERLLEWLGALGTSVVLLSATLPGDRRNRLLAAFQKGLGQEPAPAPQAEYPRVTYATAGESGAHHVRAAATRTLRLEWTAGGLPDRADAPYPLGERLRRALADGGCAAVICNTVRRAQAVYRALAPYFPGSADDGLPELDLFHARYLFGERDAREKRALFRFGKSGDVVELGDGTSQVVRRPNRAVLVATQVIEQSLDLDFDLMVTDHAPADLVLQRSGRLWRHERSWRPACMGGVPTLWICDAEVEDDGCPKFDPGSALVYDEHVLLRSWLALRGRDSVVFPGCIDEIVEATYAECACPTDLPASLREYWSRTQSGYLEEQDDIEAKAKECRLAAPNDSRALSHLTAHPQEEDAPDIHPAHQALTRLTEPTIQLICLTDAEYARFVKPFEVSGSVSAKDPPIRVLRELLRRSVTLSDKRVVFTLMAEEPPRAWQDSATLRHSRFRPLDRHAESSIGKYRLRIDPDLGVVISGGEMEGAAM